MFDFLKKKKPVINDIPADVKVPKAHVMHIKVYDNQEQLKKAHSHQKPFDKRLDVVLSGETENGELAIKVLINDIFMGYVEKNKLKAFSKYYKMPMAVNKVYLGYVEEENEYYADIKITFEE